MHTRGSFGRVRRLRKIGKTSREIDSLLPDESQDRIHDCNVDAQLSIQRIVCILWMRPMLPLAFPCYLHKLFDVLPATCQVRRSKYGLVAIRIKRVRVKI